MDRVADGAAIGRRALLAGALGTNLAVPALAAQDDASVEAIVATHPEPAPAGRWAISILARVGDAMEVGEGPDGARRIVPIVGGSFQARSLRGIVLPGGADRQRLRGDGIRELDALYELRGDDGTLLTVHNQVMIDNMVPPGQPRYARSVVRIAAPQGPHGWLNRRIFVGTLTSLRPARPLVLIRVYEM
ncbi:DUF3237 domain-containing protein [Sphingomonas zeae]|jgi:hypothetical protein|uniref:DUF3237 domain-containing protein n=1 Tax=Sphingomonas zeae TaxID=1646122 RepID=A0A7Y6B5Q1_9SPHN|nr:DUF3237 domain-containing protein [Sphingomonas zeae]MBB4048696.1 hypothetical protein [Sphingomonas zeae]NUU47874.1 DUF3237 domain-containing protein [Sphingomonas zeae]PZR80299.1 MAG: DUF3237 domain-containing protein [Stutzerimonas stutzeri]